MKFLICQIPLKLKSDPYEIINIDEHISIKKKCVEYAINKQCDVIIFPEYTYHPSEYNYLLEKSNELFIFAGSYQDMNNKNTNMVFYKEQVIMQSKVCLSPYEKSCTRKNNVIASTEPLKIIPVSGKYHQTPVNTMALVCYDYIDYFRKQNKDFSHSLLDERILLVISQCCNDKTQLFLKKAESNHYDLDYTTIFCNVSKLSIDNNPYIKYGKSSVFGIFGKDYQKANTEEVNYRNNINICPDEDCVCEIDLQIPYSIQRASTINYTTNPTLINYSNLSEL